MSTKIIVSLWHTSINVTLHNLIIFVWNQIKSTGLYQPQFKGTWKLKNNEFDCLNQFTLTSYNYIY